MTELRAPVPRRSLLRAHRGALALLAVAVAFITTATYWLATTGATSPSIGALPGSSSTGAVADVTAMSSSVTRTNGSAQLQTGVALDKVVVAKTASNHFRLVLAWTNAQSGAQVLNNPNAQISVGVYHPIHTGNCVGAAGSDVDSPLVNITDPDNSQSLCGSLDQSATGSSSVSSTGKLLLAQNLVSGFLDPALDGSATLSACASAVDDNGGWCQPSSVSDSNKRALYLIASIVTPGGIPQGQQASLTSLTFFTKVRRLS